MHVLMGRPLGQSGGSDARLEVESKGYAVSMNGPHSSGESLTVLAMTIQEAAPSTTRDTSKFLTPWIRHLGINLRWLRDLRT